MQERISRIRYQCRRGMLELDAILQPFFEKHFLHLTQSEQVDFEKLLTCTDQELYHWFIESEQPRDINLRLLIAKIKRPMVPSQQVS